MSDSLKDSIINDINSNDIILYMKGTKEMPMCGFSSTVVKVLNMHNVNYKDINVNVYQKFKEWLVIRQSAKFAKELKRKGYKPREPWDVGIWK